LCNLPDLPPKNQLWIKKRFKLDFADTAGAGLVPPLGDLARRDGSDESGDKVCPVSTVAAIVTAVVTAAGK
jgi:hypothetical protein